MVIFLQKIEGNMDKDEIWQQFTTGTLKEKKNQKLDLCKDTEEIVYYILILCKKIVQTEYKQQYNIVIKTIYWDIFKNDHVAVMEN